MATSSNKLGNLLHNLECEYKYALNPQYAESFIAEFCLKFNEIVSARYANLDESFKKAHPLEEFIADAAHARRQALANEYFDTKDDLFFKNFMAGLRLRRAFDVTLNADGTASQSQSQGEVEMTIKCKSQDPADGASHTHSEYNLTLDHDIAVPDLSLFALGTLPEGMVKLTQEHPLISKYKTDFVRQSLTFKVPLFLSFELAVDLGEIVAGSERSQISEVEFELKDIDPEFLENTFGHTIYDLDDIRLEFSTMINEIMLLISGAPQEYLDSTHIFGLVGNSEVKPLGAAVDYEAIAATTLGAADSGAATADINAADSTVDGAVDSTVSTVVSTSSLSIAPASSSAAGAAQSKLALNLTPLPQKQGGLIGLEPLSKLKRAVVLNARFGGGEPDRKMNKEYRIDVEALKAVVSSYNQCSEPSLALFLSTIEQLSSTLTNAFGLANLFGRRENLNDVRDVMAVSIHFAQNHKPTQVNEVAKSCHRRVCQDPELSDLSMLSVCECFSLFIELNVNLWIMPFYQQLCQGLEHDDFDGESFKLLSRSAIHNSYALKISEYIERIVYILRRCLRIFCTCNNGPEVDPDLKAMALATQHHLRLVWSNINLN